MTEHECTLRVARSLIKDALRTVEGALGVAEALEITKPLATALDAINDRLRMNAYADLAAREGKG